MNPDLPKGVSGLWHRAMHFVDHRLLESQGGAPLELPPLSRQRRGIELLFVFLAVLVYCLPFLNFGSLDRLRGNESEVFQSLDQLLSQSITQDGRFPLWNPYIYSGIPYAADPMLHAYNPFISLPVLLFGTADGFKIAVFLGFLIGALGMWWLARLLRLGTVGRVWMALLYTFSGAAMARFFQGQYLLQIAPGWLPWIIGGLYASIVTRRRKYIGVAALSLGLLFLCGNAYYAYYMLYAAAILALVMVVRFTFRPLRLRLDLPGIKVLLAIGVLALGLTAAQLLPLTGFWNLLSKQTDRSLNGSQTVQQVVLDLTSTDSHRPDAFAALPREEFYAYIGVVPLILLVFLPFGWGRGRRRALVYFVLLIIFAFLWIDVRDMPWKSAFENIQFLYQFRYPTRMLIFLTLSLVTLSGMAADGLYRNYDSSAHSISSRWPRLASTAGKYVIAALLLASAVSVAAVHRRELIPEKYYGAPDVVLGWLKQHDNGIYYVAAPNGWHHAMLTNQLRYLNAWWPFNDIQRLDNRINRRDVAATPKYEILGNDVTTPPGATLVRRFDQHTIYEHPDSLPFAFTVPTSTLTTPAPDGSLLQQKDTTEVAAYAPNTDSLETIVNGEAGQTLVLLSTLAPGWQLTVDNRRAPILNVSGYAAASLVPGTHRYLFTYRPGAVPWGWTISLLFLLITGLLAGSDVAWNWGAVLEGVRDIDWRGPVERARNWKPSPLEGEPSGEPESPQYEPVPAPVASIIELPPPEPEVEQEPEFDPSASVLDYLRYQVKHFPGSLIRGVKHRRKASQRVNMQVVVAPRTRSPRRTSRGVAFPAIALQALTWPAILFISAVGIYLLAVLLHNSDFPIFFFTDEAVHMNQAADLLLHGFENSQHEFLPTYFNIGTMFSLNSLSVYLQVIPYLLFGKSVAVTRGVSSLITALGAIAASLALRNVFKIRQYWLGVLLLIASPAWFLNSRTAFEYAELAAFYSIFIYCYLEYRSGKPRYLYATVVSGAAVFYTHGLGQVLIGVAGIALFLVDLRFHFRPENRRTLLYAFGLAVLLAVPYFRYLFAHPDVTAGQISQRGSYLVDNKLTVLDKVGRFAHEYFYGLNPLYWYVPNDHDLLRHVMKGYGAIWIATLPFALLGLYLAARKLTDPLHRVLIVALLAAPVPASLVGANILREFWVMVPITLLTALGMAGTISWLEAKYRTAVVWAPALTFAVLAGHTLFMLNDALTNGPLWYQDYTLYGMQYGGKQLFADAILNGLRSDPNVRYVVTPNWANGTDQLKFFFIPPQYDQRVQFGTVGDFLSSKQDLTSDTVLVTLPDEYQKAKASPLFSGVDVIKTLPWPNGQPGFYFLHVSYADNVDAVFAQMEAERRKPVQGTVTVQGDPATITYSRIEAGQPSDMFDGNLTTLVRGIEANPFIVDLVFERPMPMSSMTADFGLMSIKVDVSLYPSAEDTPIQFTSSVVHPTIDPHVQLGFGASYTVLRVHIEVTDLDLPGQAAKIHIRELRFNP